MTKILYNPVVLQELANEYDLSDPIDWGMLPVDEDIILEQFAETVADILNKSDNPELVSAAAMTKLLAENYILNLQLIGQL